MDLMTAPINARACMEWNFATADVSMVRNNFFLRATVPLIFALVCGNGIITINEDCDGGAGCNMTTCKCEPGYQPYIVSQECRRIPSAFVPSVGPSLDCLNIIDYSSMILYFSFVNNDGFDLTIPFGDLNKFIPTDLAVSFRKTFSKVLLFATRIHYVYTFINCCIYSG